MSVVNVMGLLPNRSHLSNERKISAVVAADRCSVDGPQQRGHI